MSAATQLKVVPERINEQVVSALERALAKAKAGEVREVHIVLCCTDTTITLMGSKTEDTMRSIGALEYLKDNILHPGAP